MPNHPPGPFSTLQYPAFRMIWAATMFANLGALVQNVSAAWLMAALTTSHDMIALVQASTMLPFMVLAIMAGAVADNFDHRAIMLASLAFMASVSSLMAVASWLGRLTPWSLLGLTFMLGLGAAMHLPAWQSSIRDLVPRNELASAVTLNSMSYNLMRSVGPAIGGFIVAGFGPTAAFSLNAISYFGVMLVLFFWRPERQRRSLPAERLGSAISAGVRYVWLSPDQMRVIIRSFVFGVGAIAVLALLPVIVRDVMKAEAWVFGILFGGFGFGGVIGALISGWLRRLLPLETVVVGAFLISAIGCLLLGETSWLIIAFLAMTLGGLGWVSALSLFNASIQLSAPKWVLGRALSIYQTAAFGGMAFGSWLWGWISDTANPQTALVSAALWLVVGALIGLRFRTPDISDLDLEPANLFHEPSLRLDLKASSGPIVVMIDWRIPEDRVMDFLPLMAERRRIRRRDGVLQWALLRDLENPDLWVESYHVASWVDYVRHNLRRTKADMMNLDGLMALHVGSTPPSIHRMIERHSVPVQEDLRLL